MSSRKSLGIILVVGGLVGLLLVVPFSMMMTTRLGQWSGMGSWMMDNQSEYSYSDSSLLSIDQAKSVSEQYLGSLNNPNLAVKEIMEFEDNFYIIFFEESTGIGVFEMLIWKKESSGMMGSGMDGYGGGIMVGQLVPEPGPNMMWNTKYGGMMGGQYQGSPTADMPIGEDEAKRIGQQYLDEYFPGTSIVEETAFYGYYTFDFGTDGDIIGMFSVNGYTGQVWYHGWHGAFIGMEEYGEVHHD